MNRAPSPGALLTVSSISSRDYSMIMGTTLLYATLVVIGFGTFREGLEAILIIAAITASMFKQRPGKG